MTESAEKLLTLTHKQIVDAAIEASVRGALEAVGLDVIKSEPFFGMGERSQVVLNQAALAAIQYEEENSDD